eukprot:gene13446-21145_t
MEADDDGQALRTCALSSAFICFRHAYTRTQTPALIWGIVTDAEMEGQNVTTFACGAGIEEKIIK